jgi:hypothetical protein
MANNCFGIGKLLLLLPLLLMHPDKIYLILITILWLGLLWILLHLEDLLFRFGLVCRVDRRSRATSALPAQVERRGQRDFPFPRYVKSTYFFGLLALFTSAHLIAGVSVPVSRFFEKSLKSYSNTHEED